MSNEIRNGFVHPHELGLTDYQILTKEGLCQVAKAINMSVNNKYKVMPGQQFRENYEKIFNKEDSK